MSHTVLLCQLDKKTQLVANNHAFVIKKLVKVKSKDGDAAEIITDSWVSQYFYADIGDAVRGYVKHALRKPQTELNGDICALVATIEKLEGTIKTTAVDFQKAWNDRMQDPVDAHLLKCGVDNE
jgi:hypothetical protein